MRPITKTVDTKTSQGYALLMKANSNPSDFYLDDIYQRHCHKMDEAWRECFATYLEENGTGFHICSHNSYQFSVAWKTPAGVRYITKDTSYLLQ